MALLTINDLRVWFHTRDGIVRAVDGVDFSISSGETIGIVGESGCGKSVLFYSLLRLLPVPPARIETGQALFEGVDLLRVNVKDLRTYRGRKIGVIFQDPMTALNPYMTIGRQVMEPFLAHRLCNKKEAWQRAVTLLESVGIQDVHERMRMYPHEFSGGMRQRIGIAMALAAGPDLLVADEPTTALDVTVQAQILALLTKLQQERGMAVVLISHDMGVVAGSCERVMVMYAGRMVENAPVRALFRAPMHPYTQALLDSLPGPHRKGKPLRVIPGIPPDHGAPVRGCSFAPRCSYAKTTCYEETCVLRPLSDSLHQTACVRVQRGEIKSCVA